MNLRVELQTAACSRPGSAILRTELWEREVHGHVDKYAQIFSCMFVASFFQGSRQEACVLGSVRLATFHGSSTCGPHQGRPLPAAPSTIRSELTRVAHRLGFAMFRWAEVS